MKSQVSRHHASFRDPNGFLFQRNGVLYRQVNAQYLENYRTLKETGLFQRLVDSGYLIPHHEVDVPAANPEIGELVLEPEPLQFISYPYEWSFDQLKDAALTTLKIQAMALKHEMTLKDASAYNIQFYNGRPLLIDTLSFEKVRKGQPWVAYRQFCQHFLAPLALMTYQDIRLGALLRVHIDGIPLDLAADLLPRRTLVNFGLLVHLHLHASAQRRFAGRAIDGPEQSRSLGERSIEGLVENLKNTVSGLKWRAAGSWSDYYNFHSYSERSFEHKQDVVAEFLEATEFGTVLDLGANQGVFSRIASRQGRFTVAADVDPGAVQRNYLKVKADGEETLLPLLIDLTNPSPALGWAHRERESLAARGPYRAVMALALIHHLAISNNTPLPVIAEFLAELADWLIIEFVPKGDQQVQQLLASRQDIFDDYHQAGFESAFSNYFNIHRQETINRMDRVLYLMERNKP